MIHFDEASHIYTVNGRRLPSVTEILKPVSADFGMVDPAVLENARNRGVAVDRMIELHEKNQLDHAALSDEMLGYLAAWEQFKADTGFKPISMQYRVVDTRLGYAGTADALMEDGRIRVVVDVKCTAADVPSVGPQTAAYAKAGGALGRYALYLRPNSSGVIVPNLKPLTSTQDWNVFLACLTVHRFKNQ